MKLEKTNEKRGRKTRDSIYEKVILKVKTQ